MVNTIHSFNLQYKKTNKVDVRSGDTVKVHQKIQEGGKERIQIFQGLVIKTTQPNTHLGRIIVRRIASGTGVEKSFLINSPLVVKIEIVKRSKVRRNYLSYMRNRTGKSARLVSVNFDKSKVNEANNIETTKIDKKEQETQETETTIEPK